jgi:DHA1 family multidrug resistance protein-like MFS transporter
VGRAFYGLVAALVVGSVAGAPVRALLPAYIEGVAHASPAFTSLLLSIQLGVGGLFALAGGALADRFSRRTIVLLGIPSAVPGALLFSTTDPLVLVPLAIAWGVLTGFQSSGGQSFLLGSVDRTRTGTATALYFLSTTLSAAVGAWVGGVVADHFGYEWVAGGGAVLAVLGMMTAARFLPDLGSDASRQQGNPTIGLVEVFRLPGMWTIVALRFWPTVAWGIATLIVPLYLYRLAGNATVPGTYALVSLAVASAGQMVTGRLIDRGARLSGTSARSGPAGTVPAALRRVVMVIAFGLLVAGASTALATNDVIALGITGTAWTTMAWALSTTMPPLMRAVAPSDAHGRVVGATHLTWSVAMLTGTSVSGWLVEVEPIAPLAVATACLVFSSIVAVRFDLARVVPSPLEPKRDVVNVAPDG